MKRSLCCFLFLYNICFAQVNLNQGLQAYYPLNGNTNDISGNNNNPIYNNASLTVDRAGNANSAYHFNGIDNYIRIPNNPSLNFSNKISLAVWIKPTGFYYDICHANSILSKGTASYMPGNYALRFDDALFTDGQGCSGDRLKDSVHQNFRGTATPLKAYAPFIKKDQWYSLVYTNDGTTARLYVDCELKYAVNFKENFTNGGDLFIGKTDDDLFPFWLNGDVDDLRIYDRVLTEKEIFTLCNELKEKPKPPAEPVKEILLEKRNNEVVKQITVDNDSLTVTLYDNGDIDGDSVTLIYNDKIITTHQLLSANPITFKIKVAPGSSRNELVMYAENLGSIPPNTALMVIYDGNKRYELNVSSTKNSNGVVSFKLKE